MGADFKPVLDGYANLRPFMFWAQTTLPTVFDDSLSYYEVLTKLCKMVNVLLENTDTAEHNIEAIAETYEKLQDYVNHYFDNLDVSEEINAKLDQMAQDGEFDEILTTITDSYLDETVPPLVLEKIDDVVSGVIDDVVAEQIDYAVEPLVTPAVDDYLDENLPGLVDGELANVVAGQIEDVVARQLPNVSAPIIAEEVSDYMDAELPQMISDEVAASLPDEVSDQIEAVVHDQLPDAVVPYVYSEVSSTTANWLANHISNPSNPPLDNSLSIKNAAAESWYVGKRIYDLQSSPPVTIENKKVDGDTGTISDVTGWLSFKSTVSHKFPVSVGYFNHTADPTKLWTFAYFDSDDTYISGGTWDSFINWVTVDYPVPVDAEYIYFSIESTLANFVADDLYVLVWSSGKQIIDALNQIDVDVVIDPTLTQSGMAADAKVVGDDVEEINHNIENFKCVESAVKNEDLINIPVDITSGYGVLFKTGNLVSSSVFGYTDYIDVRLYESVTLKRLNLQASSVTTGIAFYDKDKNYLWGLSSIKSQPEVAYFYDTIALDDNIAYVRCTVHMDTDTLGEFTITGKSKNIEMLYGYQFEPFCPFVAYKGINPYSGAEGASSSAEYYCHTDYVDCRGFDFVRYTRIMATSADPLNGIAFYDENKNYIQGAGQAFGANNASVHAVISDCRIPTNAYYLRVCYYNYSYIRSYVLPDFSLSLIKIGNLNNRIGRLDGECPAIDGLYPYKPKNKGVENAIKRAHALSRLKWTPVGEVTRQIKPINGSVSTSKFNPGITYTGSPYAVTYQRNRNIGIETSIHTFESVVSNAGTRIYDSSLNTRYAYFGNVCSSYVAYAVGMMEAPLTEIMGQYKGMKFIAPKYVWNENSLELGSILLKPDDHVVIVTGILTDINGNIKYVEISEATLNGYIQSGKVISKWYTPEKLMGRFLEYDLYWYVPIENCEYNQSNFSQVYPEQQSTQNAKFMCISAFGDGAVFGSNNTPAEVIIDSNAYSEGYRRLKVYLDGVLVNTYNIEADTTVVNVPKSTGGEYYIVLDNDSGLLSRPTRWHVYESTFTKTIADNKLTLNYNTDATIFGISYITGTDPNDIEIFEPCKVTGVGSIEFDVASDARSFNVILGDSNGAVHKSI